MKNFRPTDEHGGWPQDWSRGVDLSPNDSLFAMLDGQIIRGRDRAWRAEVVSIVTEGMHTWVQVCRAGSPANTIVLHMDLHGRVAEALAALRQWTDTPEDSRPGRIELVQVPTRQEIEREVEPEHGNVDWSWQVRQICAPPIRFH